MSASKLLLSVERCLFRTRRGRNPEWDHGHPDCNTAEYSPHSIGIHQYLAGLARLEPLHASGKLLHCDAVRDHRMQIEFAALEQSGHLVPSLIHAASVDALHRDAFENSVFVKIQ